MVVDEHPEEGGGDPDGDGGGEDAKSEGEEVFEHGGTPVGMYVESTGKWWGVQRASVGGVGMRW